MSTAEDDMRLYRELTGRRDEIIRASYGEGVSVSRIAAGMGITRDTVYKVLGPGVTAAATFSRAVLKLAAAQGIGREEIPALAGDILRQAADGQGGPTS